MKKKKIECIFIDDGSITEEVVKKFLINLYFAVEKYKHSV